MNKALSCIYSGKNYYKIPNFLGYYVQKYNKSTGDNENEVSKITSSSSSSSSDSDDPRIKQNKATTEEKMKKLNELLLQLVQQDKVIQESKFDLSKPPNKRIRDKPKAILKPETEEQKIAKAAKNVANEVGGDPKLNESELLMKLLNPEETTTPKSLTDIIKDMKIDRESTFSDKSRADQVRSILQQTIDSKKGIQRNIKERKKKITPPLKLKTEPVMQKIDLFGADPLGIFTNVNELKESTQTKTWKSLQHRDLRLAITHPPANYFQQMILWTEQGKLWKFPIDNEQGLDEEKKVNFSQHVFLEEHLEPWCPQKGPIRHFMELVCVGLSKNSYLTVQAKKDHIEWYKNYFESKRKLLEEVGALQTN